MITTEERAAADRDLTEVAHEVDRRTIRCKCGHSLDAHPGNAMPSGDALVQFMASGQAIWTPCTRCDCQRYTSRPAVWRVTLLRPITMVVAQFGEWDFDVPVWIVTSPRGVEVCRTHHRVAALDLAWQMAALDRMLANLSNARIERTAGFWHPSQGTPPPDSLSTPVVLTVVGGGR
ncbi:hypothetical protein [Mycolicibacterium llatzerense]|uniref:hypothetical protein n=1 Tax=Mycolicibacterium llatzerense TaxID=280871 RepID=UPI0021B5894E|nr:hypothetical protein [Mycolicibacterium llatzerense]MCT7372727.1 hypothetical protein [Mycolicibacterium llatzerense]